VLIGTARDNAPVHRIAARVGAVELRTAPHALPNGDVVDAVWYAHDAS
jgi:hypothetical protein